MSESTQESLLVAEISPRDIDENGAPPAGLKNGGIKEVACFRCGGGGEHNKMTLANQFQ
jgi:hypothetical protein